MTVTFRHHSAVVRISRIPTSQRGVIEVRNTGPLTLEAFNYFRPLVITATMFAPAVVVRLDTSVDVLFDPPKVKTEFYPAGAPPQAVVVHKDQYLLWLRHVDNLRRVGVRRSVFTSARLAAALQWAELAAQREPGATWHDPVASGPAPLD